MMFYVLTFAIAWSMWALAGRFTDGASLTAIAAGYMAVVKLTAAALIQALPRSPWRSSVRAVISATALMSS